MLYKATGLDSNGMLTTILTSDYKKALAFSNNGQWPIEIVNPQPYTHWMSNRREIFGDDND